MMSRPMRTRMGSEEVRGQPLGSCADLSIALPFSALRRKRKEAIEYSPRSIQRCSIYPFQAALGPWSVVTLMTFARVGAEGRI